MSALAQIYQAPVAFSMWEGGVVFSFPQVRITLSIEDIDSLFLHSSNDRFNDGSAFCTIEARGPENDKLASFPYSPEGLPLSLASLSQVVAILHWAENLT